MRNAKTNNVPTLLKSLIGLLGSNPMNHLLEELGMKKDFDFLTNPLCLSIIKSDKFTKRKDIVVEPIIATPIPQCRDHDLNLMCGVIGQNALENAAEATRSKLEHALIPIAIRV